MALLSTVPQRVAWLDAARGAAILLMVVYHGAFDLAFFGFVDWPVAQHPLWRAFAAAIASTFLFLVGVSLTFAHRSGVRWRPFLRRLAVLVACAGAITLATSLTMPAPIYFGILHAIALFSVLGLPFVFAPGALTLVVAAAVLVVPALYRSDTFAAPWAYPLGLAPTPPVTFDYEPVFPWFAVTLLGVALARSKRLARDAASSSAPDIGYARARWTNEAGPSEPQLRRSEVGGRALVSSGDGSITALLARVGRHSLLIYLLHQPVLFAVLIALSRLRW